MGCGLEKSYEDEYEGVVFFGVGGGRIFMRMWLY